MHIQHKKQAVRDFLLHCLQHQGLQRVGREFVAGRFPLCFPQLTICIEDVVPEHVLHEALKPQTFCIVAKICFEHVLDKSAQQCLFGDLQQSYQEKSVQGAIFVGPETSLPARKKPIIISRNSSSDFASASSLTILQKAQE